MRYPVTHIYVRGNADCGGYTRNGKQNRQFGAYRFGNASIGLCIYPTIHKLKAQILDCQFAHGRRRKAPYKINLMRRL